MNNFMSKLKSMLDSVDNYIIYTEDGDKCVYHKYHMSYFLPVLRVIYIFCKELKDA